MGALWEHLLEHFFTFSCTQQGLEIFMLVGTIFDASPKGKSRCFVKDILQKSSKRHSSKRESKWRPRGLHLGAKNQKKTILAGIKNRIVFEIDFGSLLGPLLGPKFQHLSLTFCYTFENLTLVITFASKMQPGSLQGGSAGLRG